MSAPYGDCIAKDRATNKFQDSSDDDTKEEVEIEETNGIYSFSFFLFIYFCYRQSFHSRRTKRI